MERIRAKIFSTDGKAERWWIRDTRAQEGLAGWRRAQERALCIGFAGEVIGDISLSEVGVG